MKRKALISHLIEHGCIAEREGGSHSLFKNPTTGEIQAVPRHVEIKKFTARSVCRGLSVPVPKGA